ncbi:glycosyltransferase family 2 protein [Massilia solisilvae]|uniref:Glycosyltransferase family 2 protein n=1 Tax=Massilia solisilvae TaxID=1811225 RepID=A0ABT2BQF7_9BURK|nr:glycosyltransferase family 2 protein [Massilia solisilvae]MCS0610290.1 glycosyltransferase family 2 protein [Massilia solisilvae]
MNKTISVIVPCFNESGSLSHFVDRFRPLLPRHPGYTFEVVFVNDGSADDTFSRIRALAAAESWVKGINLTRNFGKEAALTAGLDYAHSDAVVFMDADLQHPPEVVSDFIARWEQGHEVVVGRRVSRDTDTRAYRLLANVFYRISNRISDVKLSEHEGDFRLIDRKVADKLRQLRENRRFMKGLFAWVGYEPVFVEYEVGRRINGVSSFNTWRSWNFALEGITSFSTVPLRIWSYLGGLVLLIGLGYLLAIVLQAILYGVVTPGYVTLLAAVVGFSGVLMIGIGILGEYIGRIYMEVKQRPTYLVKEMVSNPLETAQAAQPAQPESRSAAAWGAPADG